jgi:N-acetylglucosaminyl-diphospho-decaprenol L-rhamnosyltransferase
VNPTVAVAIVAHGNRDLVLETLASLTGPGRPSVPHTIAVLDNASEDGTVEAIRERFPDVLLIDQPFRAGFGANHNRLLAACAAPYHLILNDDARVESHTVDRLIAHLEANPAVGVAAPVVRYPDGRHQPSAYRFPDPATSLRSLLTLGQLGVEQRPQAGPTPVDWASGCALLLRRSALDRCGTFDEGFFMFSEEVDLQRRLREWGFHTEIVPAARVVHHVGAASGGEHSRRAVEFWRSRRRYWAKHHPGWEGTTARTLLGAQYGALAGIAELRRLPGPLRGRLAGLSSEGLRLHARNALRGPTGPGLREGAEEWNRRHRTP